MIAHGIGWPAFFALYGAISGLVILIFLLRLARPGRAVSSTLIWEKVLGARQSFWKELLSLLVQIVLVGLVCLALADPRPEEKSARRRHVGLVFDASESMNARENGMTRLELAAKEASGILAALGPRDRAMVVSASNKVEAQTALTESRDAVMKAVRKIRGLGVEPRVREAAAFILDAFHYAGLGTDDTRHIFVFTDDPEAVDLPEEDGVDIRTVVVGRRSDNLAVTSFDVRKNLNLSGTHEALVRVQNFGASVAKADLVIFSMARGLGRERISLAPGEEFFRVVGLALDASGKITAILRNIAFEDGGADALSTDDAAFAFVSPSRRSRVLLVTKKNPFLQNALALDPGVALKKITPDQYDRGASARFDVTVFDKFTPGQAPLSNAVYFSPAPGGPFAIKETKEDPAMTDWAGEHPVLRHVRMDQMTIKKARVLVPQAKDQVLMGHFNGALVLERKAAGRWMLAVGFALEDSDFPLQSAFPVFMHNVIRVYSARQKDEGPANFRVGESVEFPVSSQVGRIALQDPLGEESFLTGVGGRVRFVPSIPGFYSVGEGKEGLVFAVSLASEKESDLRVPAHGPGPTLDKDDQDSKAGIFWPYFIIAALVLAALDTVLFFGGRLS